MSVPERQPADKARVAMVKLRAPWIYGERGNTPAPGLTSLLDATQIRAAKRAVRKAMEEGTISLRNGREELAELSKGAQIIRDGPLRTVGAYFPEKGCWDKIVVNAAERRKKNKVARQARKRQRPHKKHRR